TAALDVESEAEVMHALDKLVVGRTVLMISHRLSTLGNVDEIIVLKDGQIAERGTFKDLKNRGGVFAKLLEEQNRYNQDKAGDKSILRSAFVPVAVGAGYAQQQGTPYAPMTPVPPVAPQWQGNVPVTPMGQPVAMRPNGNPPAPIPGQRPPTARVMIEVDGKPVGQHVLNKPTMTIGRLSSNDIQIPSQRVSRLHAKIYAANGNWIVEDAESLNGLVFQGKRVDQLVLTPGTSIYMAPTVVLHYQTA
ncbi:MAG: FHA domain-containing protein, partial [Ktedonobacteraceae bacterium]